MTSHNTDIPSNVRGRNQRGYGNIYIIGPKRVIINRDAQEREAEVIRVLKQKALPPNVTIKKVDIDIINDIINEGDRTKTSGSRIKTTIGFDRETYIKLKALSIATNEDMQDIIAKALHEYFEKEDVKKILSTYFASLSEKSTSSTNPESSK